MYSIIGGSIWPIVAISKHGLVFACLPFVNIPNAQKRQLSCIEMGPVAIGYSLLQNISDVVGQKQPPSGITDDKIQELRDYLFICMPFGTPTEMDPSTVRGIIASKDSYLLPKTKAPAWRPVFHKGKQQISISIQEKVRCIQYDNPERADLCEIYGTVVCKADLEGAPEVSLDVVSTLDPTILENIVFHPCTQLSDTVTPVMTVDDKRIMDEYRVKTIRFCPPLETFRLFHYKSSLNAPPVMAYYKMTDDEHCAKISIQLKLWKNVKNSFEHLKVIVPFFNRKQIQRIDYSPMTSNCVILDKNTVCWNVGSKLPSKTLQASLEGTVHFDRSDKPVVHPDKFCVGLNSYIKISFKIADYTYSGIKIDNRSVSIYPNSKVKTSTAAEFACQECKVWNSLCDPIC
ncbi:AP-5 complex subunit mu-1-like isoform X1 [Rhopilema esculentum]|uniref:AP-5 complex subunit mu-1-like isoform X1 n=2 Tax=Rhopilema esculentum TaxID=499914 RepID=UPI0031DB71C9